MIHAEIITGSGGQRVLLVSESPAVTARHRISDPDSITAALRRHSPNATAPEWHETASWDLDWLRVGAVFERVAELCEDVVATGAIDRAAFLLSARAEARAAVEAEAREARASEEEEEEEEERAAAEAEAEALRAWDRITVRLFDELERELEVRS